MIELFLIILAILAGILTGILTGLLPGVHINLVASLVLIFAISYEISLPLAIFIVVLSFTHIIIDFIPTTLLGVPGEENFLSTLPAHSLVKQGKAYEAIRIAFLGIIYSIPLFLIVTPIYILFLPKLYNLIELIIPFALIFASFYLILREKNILAGLIIFTLSGILGYCAFNLPISDPLLPLLTGLFGISSILTSMEENESIAKQKLIFNLKKKQFLKTLLPASIITPLCSFLPGIGSGHISMICSEITAHNKRQFIFLNSLVSSFNMALSIVAAYAISKTRSGSAVAIKSLLSPFSLIELIILLGVAAFTILLVVYLGEKIARLFIRKYDLISQRKLNTLTLIFIILLNITLTNSLGIITLIASASLGLFTYYLNVRKIQLMGSLVLPTIIFYLV